MNSYRSSKRIALIFVAVLAVFTFYMVLPHTAVSCVDNDGDGFSVDASVSPDCDDNDASVYPGADELCDGKDNDCNSEIDDGISCGFSNIRAEWQPSCGQTIPSVPAAALDLSWDYTASHGIELSGLCSVHVLNSSADVVWDADHIWCGEDVVEYSGQGLIPGETYSWRVGKYDTAGTIIEEFTDTCQFRVYQPDPPASNRLHIRLYKNFADVQAIVDNGYDLTYSSDTAGIKSVDPDHVVLPYDLHAGMMTPYKGGTSSGSQYEKANQLRQWWCDMRGACNIPATWLCEEGMPDCHIPVEAESMFLHFRNDLTISNLPLGVTGLYSGERTGPVKGWDPDNDLDGDGVISDAEWDQRVNTNAGARVMQDARVPAYYWGYFWEYLKSLEGISDPVAHKCDFAMNLGNADYRKFMAEHIAEKMAADPDADGVYFDTASGYWEIWNTSRWAQYTDYAEYSNQGDYLSDDKRLFKAIRVAIEDAVTPEVPGDKIIAANGWHSVAHVIDATQWENWLNISMPYEGFSSIQSFSNNVDRVVGERERGIILNVQFNPVYDEIVYPFGNQAPVERSRDQLYGLASYYLVAGERTYFSYGMHPYYAAAHEFMFDAIEVDVGQPDPGSSESGDYYTFVEGFGVDDSGNMIQNGTFDSMVGDVDPNCTGEACNDPAEWIVPSQIEGHLEVVAETECDLYVNGVDQGRCAKISRSDTTQQWAFPYQLFALEAGKTYTLSGYVRTENVADSYGANISGYDFDIVEKGGTNDLLVCERSAVGTTGWTFNQCQFTMNADATAAKIYFRIQGGTGTAWFDNIDLRENNMIQNGTFDSMVGDVDPNCTGEACNDPAEWIIPSQIEGHLEVVAESECDLYVNGVDQGRCAKISRADTTHQWSFPYQLFALEAGKTYTLSGYVRTENVADSYGANISGYDFDIVEKGGTNDLLVCERSAVGTTGWTFNQCQFTMNADATAAKIYFRIQGGTGTAWFDNIDLREGTSIRKGLPRIVLARNYTKSLVLVRPRATSHEDYEDPVTYSLGGTYFSLNADGSVESPADSITLRNGEAAILIKDSDGDGYRDSGLDGQVDCDVENPDVHPGAAELCNGIDDNCDGIVDDNYVFGGFQQPIHTDGSSIFKLGRTIPVKIRLGSCSGQSISTVNATIAVYWITDAILGTVEQMDVEAVGNANTDNIFRYDETEEQYIYNLSTANYTEGSYRVEAHLDNGEVYSVQFSLKIN